MTNHLHQHILDALPVAAFAKDLDGNILYQNEKAKKILEQQNDTASHKHQYHFKETPLVVDDQQIGTCTVVVDTFQVNCMDEDSFASRESTVSTVTSSTLTTSPNPGSLLDPRKPSTDTNPEILLQNMPVGFSFHEIVRDETGKAIDYSFLQVNERFSEMTGLQQDVIGKTVTEVLPGIEDDPVDWIGQYEKVVDTQQPWTFECFSRCLQRWFSGTAFHSGGDKFTVLFLEITSSKDVEKALIESEERHRNLFESMVQGVVYHDSKGYVLAANPSAERIIGLTLEEMRKSAGIGPWLKSIREDGSEYPPDDLPCKVALRTGKPATGVVMGLIQPGWSDYRWIAIDSIPRFRDGEDKPYQVYTTFSDMTATKQVEINLKRAKEKAEEADQLKSNFLANMSHEVRTPLNGILGNLQLCLMNNLSEDYREENLEGLRTARQSGVLLLTILQDILDLSKLEAGQLTISNEFFQLPCMVDQVIAVGRSLLVQRNSNAQIHCILQDCISNVVEGDAFRIMQVLNNLMSNAVKFTEQGSITLSVGLVETESMIEFRVQDTGKGVPPEFQETIFRPFRQVDESDTKKHGGTGLGLTISKKLVEMMGGQMRLEASSVEPGSSGSTFLFTIPYVPGDECEAPKPQRCTAASLRVQGQKTVLLVEDDKVSRKVATKMLERAGCSVLTAVNGVDAIQQYKEHKDVIDLILMDVQMPLLGGLEATRRIRSEGGDAEHLPIIALSAGAMKGDREKGMQVGMTDYLTKPVNYKLLVETLDSYIGLQL